jgi:hypothetical protein
MLFLSCKANARVRLAKTGHSPHSSTLVVICVVLLLFVLFCCYLCCSVVICVVLLLFVLFCVLFVCKCVLPPGDNPIAVNKNIVSYSLLVSGSHAPIIRRIHCINTTSGICHCVYRCVCVFGHVKVEVLPPQHGRNGPIQTCTPNGHLYRVSYTRSRIDTINSPDDGNMAARNVYRIEINKHEKELCVKLVICKDILYSL